MSRVGFIGCGNIAPQYARTLHALGIGDQVVYADGLAGRADAFAAKYGGTAATVEELLADDTIDAIVNLTPAHAHTAVTGAILESGHAVFSEKPLGIDLDEGRHLIELADRRGLRLGCAPDTFMGVGLQVARAAIDRGMIGEPLAASAFMLGFGPEWWHPNPEIFYGPGAGPLFDMGPYYLTALTNLLGPARSISAAARIGIEDRVIHATGRVGEVVKATVPTHVSSIIEHASGPISTLVTSFDVKATRFRNIEIYGTEATLAVPDPNTFEGPVLLRGLLGSDWRELDLPTPNVPMQRGIGLADLLSSVRAGRPHRASGEMALHVLELMTGSLRSALEGRRLDLVTTFDRPEPMQFQLPTNTFD